MTEALDGWNEFHVALAGAAAALVGLLIVAMSVNIDKILASPSLPARAASAIASLTAAVAFSLLALVPGQPEWALGAEVLVMSAALWLIWVRLVRVGISDRTPEHPLLPKVGIAVLAPAIYTVGGILLVVGLSGGVVWIAIGSIVAIAAGVLYAWVALVEILR